MKDRITIPQEEFTRLIRAADKIWPPPAPGEEPKYELTLDHFHQWLKNESGKDIARNTAHNYAKKWDIHVITRGHKGNGANISKPELIAKKVELICQNLGIPREPWWDALLRNKPTKEVQALHRGQSEMSLEDEQ